MKRRGFLGALIGTPAAALAGTVHAKPVFKAPGKSGFVKIAQDVKEGDRLFCSDRGDGMIDAWHAEGEFHAIALHDVNMAMFSRNPFIDSNGKLQVHIEPTAGLTPAQLTVAVRFI